MAALREGTRRWSQTTSLKEAAKHAPVLVRLEEGHRGPTEETSISKGDIMALERCKNLNGRDVVLVHYKSEKDLEDSDNDDDEEEEEPYMALITIPLDNPVLADLEVSPMEDPNREGYQNWITLNFPKCSWAEQDTETLHVRSYQNSEEIVVFYKVNAAATPKDSSEIKQPPSTRRPVPPLPTKSAPPPTLPKPIHQTGVPAASVSGQPAAPPRPPKAGRSTSSIPPTQQKPRSAPLPPHSQPVGRPEQKPKEVVKVFDPGDGSIQVFDDGTSGGGNNDEGPYEIQDGRYGEMASGGGGFSFGFTLAEVVVSASHGSPSGETMPPERPKKTDRDRWKLLARSVSEPVAKVKEAAKESGGMLKKIYQKFKASTAQGTHHPPVPARPARHHSAPSAGNDSDDDNGEYIEPTIHAVDSSSESDAPYEEIDEDMMLGIEQRKAAAQAHGKPARKEKKKTKKKQQVVRPMMSVRPVQAMPPPAPRPVLMGPMGEPGSASIENMTVPELCRRLQECQMESLAQVCEQEGLDGRFFLTLTEETLREKPFMLNDWEITKLQRVKLGWVPRN